MTPDWLPDFGKALQRLVNQAVDAVVTGYGDDLDGFSRLLTAPVRGVEMLLLLIPVPVFVLFVAAEPRSRGAASALCSRWRACR